MKGKALGTKSSKALQDRIAQASGYNDHADALAHRDPRTGKIPAEKPAPEAYGTMMFRKLNQFTATTKCLSDHLGMNSNHVFANCSGCDNDYLCLRMRKPMEEMYQGAIKMWEKRQP